MRRQFTAAAESAEVDDALHARIARRNCKRMRRTPVFHFKRVCRSHRMHQVIGGVHADHAGGKGVRVEDITPHDFSRLGDALT